MEIKKLRDILTDGWREEIETEMGGQKRHAAEKGATYQEERRKCLQKDSRSTWRAAGGVKSLPRRMKLQDIRLQVTWPRARKRGNPGFHRVNRQLLARRHPVAVRFGGGVDDKILQDDLSPALCFIHAPLFLASRVSYPRFRGDQVEKLKVNKFRPPLLIDRTDCIALGFPPDEWWPARWTHPYTLVESHRKERQ